jgi:hypothetical protein
MSDTPKTELFIEELKKYPEHSSVITQIAVYAEMSKLELENNKLRAELTKAADLLDNCEQEIEFYIGYRGVQHSGFVRRLRGEQQNISNLLKKIDSPVSNVNLQP